MTQVVIKWFDTETGELIGTAQTVELSRYKEDNPNEPSQRVILDEIRACGKYTLTNHSVRLEMTKAKQPQRRG